MSGYVDDLRAGFGETYDLVAERFELFPIPGVTPPQEGEYSTFLIHNPQYVDGKEGAFAVQAALEREYLETLPPDIQKFYGSLIGVLFDEDQLVEIAQL